MKTESWILDMRMGNVNYISIISVFYKGHKEGRRPPCPIKPTGRQIGTIHMSKEPSRPQNETDGGYFWIQAHPGAKGGRGPPLKIQIPSILNEI